jgi:hypothetical protein
MFNSLPGTVGIMANSRKYTSHLIRSNTNTNTGSTEQHSPLCPAILDRSTDLFRKIRIIHAIQ